ncbi:MAG: hypothetical protein EPO24_01470 [Bacteroidetes bacterium]|nr:MAG: hypothetical protein EPO24_01470 [Bacteroidota bacterium]
MHLLCGEPSPELMTVVSPAEQARLQVQTENERIATLEQRVQVLQSQVSELQAQFAEFKKQFD